jgi:hypothetical protein
MEEILTQAFSTGDIKIVVVAVILYVIIYFQRKDTKKTRDNIQESLETRIALLENEVNRLKDLDLEARLAGIETSLRYIESLLKELKEKH